MPDFELLPTPTPAQVRAAREAAGLLQREAAAVIGYSRQATWSDYESGDKPMAPAAWTLFLLATGQHPQAVAVRRPQVGTSPGYGDAEGPPPGA